MEKRTGGFFGWLKKKFGIKNQTRIIGLTSEESHFSGLNSVRDNDVFMSAVYCNARNTAKSRIIHTLKGETIEDRLTYLLSVRPNEIQSAAVFWEKARINYDCDTNVFIYLDWDYTPDRPILRNLWLLDPTGIECVADSSNNLWFRFNVNGEQTITGIENLAIIPKFADKSDIFGSGNNSIIRTLDLINTNYQGAEKAIKSSAYIRFVLEMASVTTPAKKKELAKSFNEDFLTDNEYGVAVIDGGQKLTQVNSTASYIKKDELSEFQVNVYKYLGVNENILTSKANEDEYQSYYESVLEPFFVKVQDELTYKLFGERELAFGNRIEARTDRLQLAGYATRIKLAERVQLLPRYSPNAVLKILNLPEQDDGDELYENKNYQLKGDIQNGTEQKKD